MSKFAFFNQKGGVTKTTTAINIAYLCATKYNKKVLLVDLDPQKNSTSIFYPDYENNKPDKVNTIYGALIDQKPVPIVKTRVKNLDLVASHIAMARVEILLAGEIGGHFKLKEALESIERNYDIILIDCPPSLGFTSINALVYVDYVVIPISHEGFEDDGLKDLVDTIVRVKKRLHPNLQIGGFIQTKTTSAKLCGDFGMELKSKYKDKVFMASTPRAIVVPEAHNKHLTIFEYAQIYKPPKKKTGPIINGSTKVAAEFISKFNL